MILVIVESPSKAKTIEKYLGKGYEVIASKGHIVDLPKSKLGIDIEKNFEPQYEISNKQSLKIIKDKFKNAESLILAVDPDREGEAIAWHIARELKVLKNSKDKKEYKRIVFTEITKDAILSALENARLIDMNLVDAQQARRVLDRLVGYKLSPLLWKKLAIGLSAGRVQSAALKLVVDKEIERDKFIPQEYWNILISTLKKKSKSNKLTISEESQLINDLKENDRFKLIKIDNKVPKNINKEIVEKIYKYLTENKLTVKDIVTKQNKISAKPPFTTSTLQQAASNVLGYSPSKTMKVAQKLYESGLITYMRTDSTNLSSQSLEAIRKYINKKFGKEYLPSKPNYFKNKSSHSQEAHEAIRPTNVEFMPENSKLSSDQAKVYELIWKRVLSSQMSDAQIEKTSVFIESDSYLFELEGQRILFTGNLELYKNKQKFININEFKKGDELFMQNMLAERKFTLPPARYSEASLIKEMEKRGIGRPSTYAPTISTITSRKYIEKIEKSIAPTAIGKAVSKMLNDHFDEIINLDFTAQMENRLDDIAEGKENWIKMISLFYKDFERLLSLGEKNILKDDYTNLGSVEEKCPICAKNMIKKIGRFGEFLSCSDYPKCKGIMSLSKKGESQEDLVVLSESEDFLSKYKPAPLDENGKKYILKSGKFGYYWSHPDYPKIKSTKTLELTDNLFKGIYGDIPKSKDGTLMILRKGRFGEFWAHTNYPQIKEIKAIKKSEINKKKKLLGLL